MTDQRTTTDRPAAAGGSRLGHLALHYPPGDEQPARRLLELMGFTLVDNGPAPGKDGFCTVLLEGDETRRADNVMFLSAMPPEQVELEAALREAFGSDHRGGRPVVGRYRELASAKPEITSHIGVRIDSLERLEGRFEVVKYRPRPGGLTESDDAAVAERISGSPAFGGDEPESFARHWIQCFVSTDLCGYGILAFGSTFELDYVFDPFFVEPVRFGS